MEAARIPCCVMGESRATQWSGLALDDGEKVSAVGFMVVISTISAFRSCLGYPLLPTGHLPGP